MDPADRLRDAGRVVLNRVGYAAATVDDILAEAGTSRATFYRYFRNKDDLFAALSQECFAEMSAVIDDFGSITLANESRCLRRMNESSIRPAACTTPLISA